MGRGADGKTIQEEKNMICACTHRNCYFIFAAAGRNVPERCPDCGKPTVRPASPEETAWFYEEHGEPRAG